MSRKIKGKAKMANIPYPPVGTKKEAENNFCLAVRKFLGRGYILTFTKDDDVRACASNKKAVYIGVGRDEKEALAHLVLKIYLYIDEVKNE